MLNENRPNPALFAPRIRRPPACADERKEGEKVFEGFELHHVETEEATIRARVGGSGAPLLLLHGNPQTHVMWHRIAPRLAERFTVVAPDLRGYGESSKPESTPDHEPYSKRAMARDQLALMRHFGFERFSVAGHDRGGRVAYRLALDHPERVARLAVLDILPTWEHYRRTELGFAMGYWHWFFLPQPYPLPEKLIAGDPDWYFAKNWPGAPEPPSFFAPEALADYLAAFRNPATVHAICEDYRAGATIDSRLDEADFGLRKIQCPLLVLWAAKGILPRLYDTLEVWRGWADDVRGHAIDSGHYMAEERPEETLKALLDFFAA
jgi:haloacetate dehalogenase